MRALPTDLPVERGAGCAVVRFPAEVDLLNAPAIRDQLLRLLSAGVPALVLDLTGTAFLDSAGVHTIVRTQDRCAALSVPLAAAVPETGTVRRVFEVTALPRLIATATDLGSACAAVAPDPPRRRADGARATGFSV